MRITNINGNLPCIYHCNGGKFQDHLPDFYNFVYKVIDDPVIKCPNDLTILYIETDEDYIKSEHCQKYKTLLYLIDKYNLPHVNGYYKDDKVKEFNMFNKIYYILNGLKQVKTKYVLITDTRDVKIRTLDNIIDQFKSYNTRILWGCEKIQWPVIYNLIELDCDTLGSCMRYANGGSQFGYTEDCLKYFQMICDYADQHNLNQYNYIKNANCGGNLIKAYGDDQGFMREFFKNYKTDKIQIDYKSLVFLCGFGTNIYLN